MRIRRIAANDFKQLQSVDLYLPAVGRFLVQGKNEAGKSTLFEALYFGLFGKGLTGRGNDDLIGYAREKARVEIWVEARDKLFKIERSLTRGKSAVSQNAFLTIEYPDRPPDEVRGTTAVSKRLADEFGFNGEDLLNTCFVEQKKLDKLEGVDRQKREDSLMRLLNLDHLTQLERDFKITPEERKQAEFLSQKITLVRIRDEHLPYHRAKLAAVEQDLHIVTARDGLRQALAEYDEMDRQTAEAERLRARETDLRQREADLDTVKQAGQAINELITTLEFIESERERERRLREDIGLCQTAAQALPDLDRRATALRAVADRLNRLDRVSRRHAAAQADAAQYEHKAQTLRERLSEQATARERLTGLMGQVQDAQTRLTTAEQALQAWQEQAVLVDWREAYLAATSPQRAQSELAERQAERGRLRQVFDTAVAAFLAHPPAGAAALLDAVRALLAQLGDLFSQADSVAHRAGYLEGSYATLVQRAEADQARRTTLEKRLREQGAAVPTSLEEADARLAGLSALVAGRDQAVLQTEANTARDLVAALGGQRDEVQRKHDDLARQVRGQDMAQVEQAAQAARRQADKAQRILATWQPHAYSALGGLGEKPDTLAEAVRVAERDAWAARQQVEKRAGLEADARKCLAEIERLEQKMAELHPQILAVEASLPLLTPALRIDDVQPVRLTLRSRYAALGGDRVRHELAQVQQALGSAKEAREQAQGRLTAALEAARTHLRAADLRDELPDFERETVAQAYERLSEYDQVAATLQQERDSLMSEIGGLRKQAAKLEEELRLGDTPVDLAEAEAELGRLERDLVVRDRARMLVGQARERIVKRIMPHTLEYMQRILPQLTSGRYMMAHLTDDYKITVLDERAGDRGEFKSKEIFSGGCRDQLSLALRLSFALATLPAERGHAPQFIFLDEPLSAFDDERAEALLAMLTDTDSEVSRAFGQIFLISHGRVNESAFTYRIRLEAGRVADHDLPDPDALVPQAPLLELVK